MLILHLEPKTMPKELKCDKRRLVDFLFDPATWKNSSDKEEHEKPGKQGAKRGGHYFWLIRQVRLLAGLATPEWYNEKLTEGGQQKRESHTIECMKSYADDILNNFPEFNAKFAYDSPQQSEAFRVFDKRITEQCKVNRADAAKRGQDEIQRRWSTKRDLDPCVETNTASRPRLAEGVSPTSCTGIIADLAKVLGPGDQDTSTNLAAEAKNLAPVHSSADIGKDIVLDIIGDLFGDYLKACLEEVPQTSPPPLPAAESSAGAYRCLEGGSSRTPHEPAAHQFRSLSLMPNPAALQPESQYRSLTTAPSTVSPSAQLRSLTPAPATPTPFSLLEKWRQHFKACAIMFAEEAEERAAAGETGEEDEDEDEDEE